MIEFDVHVHRVLTHTVFSLIQHMEKNNSEKHAFFSGKVRQSLHV